MANNAVRFVYLSAGHPMPVPSDPNAIYFVEEAQQLWVGDKLIADHIDPVDVGQYLEPYRVKSLIVTGEGTIVSSIEFNDVTGQITVTKGNPPSIALGPAGLVPEVVPGSDNQVEVVTGMSVEGHTIYVDKTKIAFGDYMAADNGVATNATISLKRDPSQPLDAATKSYVDSKTEGLVGAMHFLGVSTTKIEDGERNLPTIDGRQMDLEGLHKGDTVVWSPNQDNHYLEFAWDGSKWIQLGDESSFAHKDIEIIANHGLVGGGNLSADVTIGMETMTGGAKEFKGTKNTELIYSVVRDEYGRLVNATVLDIKPIIDGAIADAMIDPEGGGTVTELIAIAKAEAIEAAKQYTDEAVREVTGMDVVVLGSGNAITDARYDSVTSTLTLYKNNIDEQGNDEEWDVIPTA